MDRIDNSDGQHLTTTVTGGIPNNSHHPHPSSCTMFSINGRDWIGEIGGIG